MARRLLLRRGLTTALSESNEEVEQLVPNAWSSLNPGHHLLQEGDDLGDFLRRVPRRRLARRLLLLLLIPTADSPPHVPDDASRRRPRTSSEGPTAVAMPPR